MKTRMWFFHGRGRRPQMYWICAAALPLLMVGCEEEARAPYGPTRAEAATYTCAGEARGIEVEDEPAPEIRCPPGAERFVCRGGWSAHCLPNGRAQSVTNCRVDGRACVDALCDHEDCVGGCRTCAPGSARCQPDGTLERCDQRGERYVREQQCDARAGLHCSARAGSCQDLCADAAARQSYIGCEYYAVPTLNSLIAAVADELGEPVAPELVEAGVQSPTARLCNVFKFALVIANGEQVPANVTIDNAAQGSRHLTVTPGDLETVELPCQAPGSSPEGIDPAFALMGPDGARATDSLRSMDAAFHITSDVPVTVYQFNPLEYAQPWQGRDIYSFTNDASLLLPVHSLTGNYTVMTRPTWSVERIVSDFQEAGSLDHRPGFVAMTAVGEGETEVTLEASAHTRASPDGSLPALAPGETATVTLVHGETLQLVSEGPGECDGEADLSRGGVVTTFCDADRRYDLTGTRIRASGPLSVIGGHDCSFVPHDIAACDHLEESMLPEEALGRRAIVTVAEPVRCGAEVPMLVRIMSTRDNNRVTFLPEVHAETTLDQGEFLEFEALEDFEVRADGPISVGQFLVGQQYARGNSQRSTEQGDPAFSTVAPLEQWRDSYTFLVPETLPESFVNVVALEDQSVTLDGRLLVGLQPIGETGFVASRVGVEAGTHHLLSESTFGITVYGYANFTSYMIPGGLDLYPINGPE